MKLLNSFKKNLNNIGSHNFESSALELFRFQAGNNDIYRQYVNSLSIDYSKVDCIEDIPFLPIDLFKTHEIKTGNWKSKETFLSSGTTTSFRSHHYIEDPEFYLAHARRIFEQCYGKLENIAVFAVLPSYFEQGSSSLVKMVDSFVEASGYRESGFYLENFQTLESRLRTSIDKGQTTVLFAVGYALLDLIEQLDHRLDGLIVIETGGMKGRREELTKDEFYALLYDKMGDIRVDSEYGMTELLSQAYAFGNQLFKSPAQMKILIRDVNDPFCILPEGKTGGINVIDLANIHSCAFIETRDLGRVINTNQFEVLGRIDNSDIRGCNLLIS